MEHKAFRNVTNEFRLNCDLFTEHFVSSITYAEVFPRLLGVEWVERCGLWRATSHYCGVILRTPTELLHF